MSSVQAIPSVLFLLVPLFSFFILYSSQGSSRVLVFHISSLATLSILNGALGLASTLAAKSVFASLLSFELGVSVIYLLAISTHYHTISTRLYNIILAFVLSSATLTAVVYPFAPHSIPPLVPPILTLAFAVLSLPLLALLLLARRRLPRSAVPLPPPPRSPTSKREKGAYVFADEPLMVNLCLARGGDAERHINSTQCAVAVPKSLFYPLFGAQLCTALSSALGIGSVLSGRGISRVDSVFDILQSVFLVLGIICVMFAFLFNSSSAPRNTPSPSVATPFTPPPTRSSRSPQMRSYYPTRNSPSHHPPTPTPSQLSEDFRNLRDPFASPSPGVAFGESGREFPSIGRVISGHVGASTVHPLASAPAHNRSYRSSKPRALSVPVLNLPKPRRHHRRTKKGSSQGLIASPHPPPSFPFPTHAKCHDRSAPRSKFRTAGSGASSSSSAEDAEFNPEEAILTQLLLRSLDSASQAGSGTGEGDEGLELADLLPPPATHRFTQDSTSTGATLCDSEVFRLGRGSVSTAFSSPPASPGGAKDANRSDGG